MEFLFLYFVSPILLAFLLTTCLLPSSDLPKRFYVFAFCWSIGAGFGITSILSFFSFFYGGAARAPIIISELLLATVLGAIFLLQRNARSRWAAAQSFRLVVSPLFLRRVLAAGFVILFSLALAIFLSISFRDPNGDYDAMAVWNLRARFLYRGGANWMDAFSDHLQWSHPDYPLLIPASVARGWALVGSDSPIVPIVLALLFTFAAVGITVTALSMIRSGTQGLIAGAVLLGTPGFISLGAAQYADVPLSFFLVASLALLALRQHFSACSRQFSALAGLSAGFAAWTKNEGWLVFVALMLGLVWSLLRSTQTQARGKTIAYFIIGAAPVLAIVLFFKTYIASENDVVSGDTISVVRSQVLDLGRHILILTTWQREIRNFGGWPFSMTVLLIFYFLVAGLTVNRASGETSLMWSALALMMMGYYCIYIITPYDLVVFMRYSLERLLLQLWPSVLLAYFSTVRTIEEVFSLGRGNRGYVLER